MDLDFGGLSDVQIGYGYSPLNPTNGHANSPFANVDVEQTQPGMTNLDEQLHESAGFQDVYSEMGRSLAVEAAGMIWSANASLDIHQTRNVQQNSISFFLTLRKDFGTSRLKSAQLTSNASKLSYNKFVTAYGEELITTGRKSSVFGASLTFYSRSTSEASSILGSLNGSYGSIDAHAKFSDLVNSVGSTWNLDCKYTGIGIDTTVLPPEPKRFTSMQDYENWRSRVYAYCQTAMKPETARYVHFQTTSAATLLSAGSNSPIDFLEISDAYACFLDFREKSRRIGDIRNQAQTLFRFVPKRQMDEYRKTQETCDQLAAAWYTYITSLVKGKPGTKPAQRYLDVIWPDVFIALKQWFDGNSIIASGQVVGAENVELRAYTPNGFTLAIPLDSDGSFPGTFFGDNSDPGTHAHPPILRAYDDKGQLLAERSIQTRAPIPSGGQNDQDGQGSQSIENAPRQSGTGLTVNVSVRLDGSGAVVNGPVAEATTADRPYVAPRGRTGMLDRRVGTLLQNGNGLSHQ